VTAHHVIANQIGIEVQTPVPFGTGRLYDPGADFSLGAGFGAARFSRRAVFHTTKFWGTALFGGAKFLGNAFFTGSQFAASGHFVAAEFSGDGRFDGANSGTLSLSVRSSPGTPTLIALNS
jgi:hypothetical protein